MLFFPLQCLYICTLTRMHSHTNTFSQANPYGDVFIEIYLSLVILSEYGQLLATWLMNRFMNRHCETDLRSSLITMRI